MFMFTSREKFINSSMRPTAVNRGFTLLELMIVMVIVAIGVALAVPTFQEIMQKRRLTGAAEEIAAFLALAQGEAIKRNEEVAVSIKRAGDGTTWCVGAMIKTAADDHCDCESTTTGDGDYCDFNPAGAGAPQLVNQVGFKSFTMNASSVQGAGNNDFNFNFDGVRGIKVTDLGVADGNSHDITLKSANDNYSLKVDISVTGRIRVCSPDLSKKVPGFKNCPIILLPPPPLPFP
jgi:type IV fimbrial biogenesis protein FimT